MATTAAVGAAMDAIAEAWDEPAARFHGWRDGLRRAAAAIGAEFVPETRSGRINPYFAAKATVEGSPPDTSFVLEGGEAGLWAGYHARAAHPGGVLTFGQLGALGVGFGLAIGADAVIAPDPAAGAGWWRGHDLHIGLSDTIAAAAAGTTRRAVVFECVGKPGMLAALAEAVPVAATIVVAGVCMETDAIEPALLIQKSIQLRFVFAYSAQEFADAFDMICRRPDALAPLVTDSVPLDSIGRAFDALTAAGDQVKVMVTPS